jgi:UDP-N-acetylmuramoylalanine--D-glutamate ligase
VETFRPAIGLLLNLTADHLDRYPSFAEYVATKKNLFAKQTTEDFAILNREEPLVWVLAEELPSRIISFGWEEVKQGTFIRSEHAVFRGPQGEEAFPLSRLHLHGHHNVENVMAALTAAKLWGLEKEVIQQTLEEFSGLAHRLEFIAEKNGVRYFDDSKGTNVGAVVKSLDGFNGEVILLAGGLDKGNDYTPLKVPVRQKVKKLFLFGQARERMYLALKEETDIDLVNTLDEAVSAAAASAKPGDTVLLSPACASFDMFTDYAHRGRAFKAVVETL